MKETLLRTPVKRKTIKPFLKWAGGKRQLLSEIKAYYPFHNRQITKYAEPFVGGGAVLFDILSQYDLEQVYISDVNAELINAYHTIRHHAEDLLETLWHWQEDFIPRNEDERRSYYIQKRTRFNELKINGAASSSIEKAALMIFLNKTCFNGLFRVNRKGLFNVPMGAYKTPRICDRGNIQEMSEKLRYVTIVCGDYRESMSFVDSRTFVYLDPPYRPITETASFTAYTEALFDDKKQLELAAFVRVLDQKGARIVVSNSDPKNTNINDDFFDMMYDTYRIKRVRAARFINAKGNARGYVKELLISNF